MNPAKPVLLGNLGLAYRAQGNTDTALRCFRRALEINETLGRMNDQALCHKHLANVYADAGDRSKARQHLSCALDLFRQMGLPVDHPAVAAVRRRLAGS